MKKAAILFLCILLLVCSACSKTNTNIENTTDVDTDSTSAAVDTPESKTPDTDISGIYFNIFGSEYEVSVDNETLEILKSAETATEPLATSLSLDEIGTVSITYKDEDASRNSEKYF